jgi:molybdopterin converting factor small subunit
MEKPLKKHSLLETSLSTIENLNEHLASEHGEFLNRTGMEHDTEECEICASVREANEVMVSLNDEIKKQGE